MERKSRSDTIPPSLSPQSFSRTTRGLNGAGEKGFLSFSRVGTKLQCTPQAHRLIARPPIHYLALPTTGLKSPLWWNGGVQVRGGVL